MRYLSKREKFLMVMLCVSFVFWFTVLLMGCVG